MFIHKSYRWSDEAGGRFKYASFKIHVGLFLPISGLMRVVETKYFSY